MKYLKKFENHQSVNEEFVGLAILGGFLGLMAAPAAYEWAKNFWSKNVAGSKYQETGRKEVIVTKLPEKIAVTIILSKQEREAGEVRTELREFKDNLGNIFWGYDHLWSEDNYSDYQDYLNNADLYTALYKHEDLEELKSFLQNPIRYTGNYDITKPKPIEMIYVEEGPKHPVGNY